MTYTPNTNFFGIDSFEYSVCDNDGACANATASVTVNDVNDIPVANADVATTDEDTAVVINVIANDTDVDGIIDPTSVTEITAPANGTIAIDPVTGEVTYTPNTNFFGTDTFEYSVCDNDGACANATVTVTVLDCLTNTLADCDGDGLTNVEEAALETDPNNADSDNDGLSDGEEVSLGTNPSLPDSDGDTISDGQEVTDNTNPLDDCDNTNGDALPESDCDDDGLTTAQEDAIGTDPNKSDSDGDTITDGQEVTDSTDPLNPCDSIGGVPILEAGCNQEVVASGIAVSNEIITPDNDGTNDFFRIENIESFPNNTVQVYNRWGIIVYELSGYDNSNNSFRGISNGRVTISTDAELPVGVYFYVIKYIYEGTNLSKAGYLYINR